MPASSPVKRRAPRQRKADQFPILVIEDDADQWLIMRSALSQRFPEVKPIWVNNKLQAIAQLETCAQDIDKCPRLVLLDLYLPRREDGLDLLDFVKTHSFARRPPIIVISASTDDNDITSVYNSGAFSYIVKPGAYQDWLSCFNSLRRYWWEVVTLPAYHQQYGS